MKNSQNRSTQTIFKVVYASLLPILLGCALGAGRAGRGAGTRARLAGYYGVDFKQGLFAVGISMVR